MNTPIGFIGTGRMGTPMIQNLIAAGFSVRVYSRTMEHTATVVAAGAIACGNPAATVSADGIVLTMLADDAAVRAVMLGENGIWQKLGPGGVHVSMSTIAPTTALDFAKLHEERGSSYVAAPVFGRPDVAAAGKLWVCTSGNAAAKARVRPILAALGQGVVDFGDHVESANVLKLCGNFMVAAATEAMAEAFTLAEKAEVNKQAALELLCGGLFASPIYRNYGQSVVDVSHDPAKFALRLGLKDLRLVRETAVHYGVPMPLADLIFNRLQSGVAKGRGELDWTGLALGAREDAGLNE
ncbi:MAG: NAD(P)-dependent oxidoreductase [Planctomycetes bacterium]|nr:NAD(P)-dependent oxidoreductase [Planctomycetota bacterium]